MTLIRIPKKFYDDHIGRDCEAPPVVKETKRHYYIDSAPCDAMEDLYSDALHYCDCASNGWSFDGALGLQSSAQATVRALTADKNEGRNDSKS